MMKSIRALFFGLLILSAARPAPAQMLDDLFDEEDFQSSEIDKMQKENEAKKADAQQKKNAQKPAASASASLPPASVYAPVSGPAPAVSQSPAPSPAPVSAQAQTSVPASASTPKTFALPVKQKAIQATPALPSIGSGKTGGMPKLGANSSGDDDLSLFEMRARKKRMSNTNVLKFDIAGVRLKMKPEDVIEKASEAGFSVKLKDLKVPELKEWKYGRQCLRQMAFAHDSKKICVQDAARKDQSEYIRRLVFENRQNRETLAVEFTSGFTENQAYRIRYVNKGDHSLGTTDEARYLKSRRRREFLRLLTKKYGAPDDEQALLWGISGYSAVLKADISNHLDVSLVMQDISLEENDSDVSSTDDVNVDTMNKFSF